MSTTLVGALEAIEVSGEALVEVARAMLQAAGLKMPASTGGDREQLLTRIKAEVPEAHWLLVSETVSSGVERQSPVGRWTTRVSCHYDRPRLTVVEHHVGRPKGRTTMPPGPT